MPRTVKIAVIGSGLAGLTVAHLLGEPAISNDIELEVHLFERASSLGMDSSSVSVPLPEKNGEWRIDVPMRSFQGGYYPQLIQLYKSLGVAFRQADFSYSFSLLSPPTKCTQRRITATMIYNGASGREGISMPSVLNDSCQEAQAQNASVLRQAWIWATTRAAFVLMTLMIVCNYMRLILLSVPFLRSAGLENKSLREWSAETAPKNMIARWCGMDVAWMDFTKQVLVPLFSAVCTASESDIMEHPVEEFLDYIWLTLGTHHYVVINGVRDVVARLSANIRPGHMHLSSPISAILADNQDPALANIYCTTPDGAKVYEGFHHIVFGTQANSAIPILMSYLASLPLKSARRTMVEAQLRCLASFTYRPTVVINHTDGTLMPDAERDRRDLNLVCIDPQAHPDLVHTDEKNCLPSSYTMATHVQRPPPSSSSSSSCASATIYQTTNPIISPCPSSILSTTHLERAVLTRAGKEAVAGLYREKGRRWWECAVEAQSALGPLQGKGAGEEGTAVWVVGSYAYPGIPLLEGCVVSARNVAMAIIALESESGVKDVV